MTTYILKVTSKKSKIKLGIMHQINLSPKSGTHHSFEQHTTQNLFFKHSQIFHQIHVTLETFLNSQMHPSYANTTCNHNNPFKS